MHIWNIVIGAVVLIAFSGLWYRSVNSRWGYASEDQPGKEPVDLLGAVDLLNVASAATAKGYSVVQLLPADEQVRDVRGEDWARERNRLTQAWMAGGADSVYAELRGSGPAFAIAGVDLISSEGKIARVHRDATVTARDSAVREYLTVLVQGPNQPAPAGL